MTPRASVTPGYRPTCACPLRADKWKWHAPAHNDTLFLGKGGSDEATEGAEPLRPPPAPLPMHHNHPPPH